MIQNHFYYFFLHLAQITIEKRTVTKQATSSAPPTAITIHIHIGSTESADTPGESVSPTK